MEVYLVPIKSAFFAFPFIALIFTLPYCVTQYKKFGAIPFWRSAIMYSFILYLINMYFFVILPLPPVDEVAGYTGSTMQLVPFQFVSDFIKKSNFDITNPGTYVGAFTDSSFFVVLFNLLLFVPLGIYLRYYFKWGWKKTLAAAFGVSMFFEVTQLTGLYGIYPRPYRLFDVDDLLLNTLGGVSGYWMTPMICSFLPSRERIDEMAYEKGERVPLMRRFLALMLDWITMGFFTVVLQVGIHILEGFLPSIAGSFFNFLLSGISGAVAVLILYTMVVPYAVGGYTFGKWFFRMRLADEGGGRPAFRQYALRYALLYGLVVCGPGLVVGCFYLASMTSTLLSILLALTVLFIGGVWLLFLWESLAQLFGRRSDYFYGRISHTCNKNMILPRKTSRGDTDKEEGTDKATEAGTGEEAERGTGTGAERAATETGTAATGMKTGAEAETETGMKAETGTAATGTGATGVGMTTGTGTGEETETGTERAATETGATGTGTGEETETGTETGTDKEMDGTEGKVKEMGEETGIEIEKR